MAGGHHLTAPDVDVACSCPCEERGTCLAHEGGQRKDAVVVNVGLARGLKAFGVNEHQLRPEDQSVHSGGMEGSEGLHITVTISHEP